jgi:hypothetical protein
MPSRLIRYDQSLVPEGGAAQLCAASGPLSIGHKEPAGHFFHTAILKQQGLYGEGIVGRM